MTTHAISVDVEQYRRDGYLTAPAVLTTEQLAMMREEADRLVSVCSSDPERYKQRIEWERNYLPADAQSGMEKVIRKLEPVSDLSPLFAEAATFAGIVDPVSAIFGED